MMELSPARVVSLLVLASAVLMSRGQTNLAVGRSHLEQTLRDLEAARAEIATLNEIIRVKKYCTPCNEPTTPRPTPTTPRSTPTTPRPTPTTTHRTSPTTRPTPTTPRPTPTTPRPTPTTPRPTPTTTHRTSPTPRPTTTTTPWTSPTTRPTTTTTRRTSPITRPTPTTTPWTSPTPHPTPSSTTKMPFMPYDFDWGVKNEKSGNIFSHKEKSGGQDVQGEYRVLLPDGRTQVVSFWADENSGYNAKVKYI